MNRDLKARLWMFLVALAPAIAASPARAQCGPDGLDSAGCCVPASGVRLPDFPSSTQRARLVVFEGCNVDVNFTDCFLSLPAPTPLTTRAGIVCGVYRMAFSIVSAPSGMPIWSGEMVAHYSRNWVEAVPGITYNVWRFLLNGDLRPASVLPGAWVPAGCASTHGRVYFTGYIDFAQNCATGAWSIAWALSHECDAIHHRRGTARPAPPGGFHPTRSFLLVGPSDGFVVAPASGLALDGTAFGQAARWNDWSNLPNICRLEERAAGSFEAGAASCVCGGSGPAQYVRTAVSLAGDCGTGVSPGSSPRFVQKRIGSWTNSAVFPGGEALLLNFGLLIYGPACLPTVSTEWFEGVTTIRGYPARDHFGNAIGFNFADLGSANRWPTLEPRWIGAPHVTRYVMNMNL